MQAKQFYIVSQRTEIAIKAFCITQTEERLKQDGAIGKHNLAKIQFDIKEKVRQTIEKLVKADTVNNFME